MRFTIATALVLLLGFPSSGAIQAADNTADNRQPDIEDERVKSAYEIRLKIEQQEVALAKQLEELLTTTEAALESVDVDTLENIQPTLDGLAELARRLEEMGKQLVLEYERYNASHGSYQKISEIAPKAYQDAAEAAKEWAKESDDQSLKEDYLRMSEIWLSLSTHFTDRGDVLESEAAELEETIRFLKEKNLFLGRFRQHVVTLPSLDSIVDTKKYLNRLKVFIKNTEKFRGLFHKLHADLVSNSTSTALRQRTADTHLTGMPHDDSTPSRATCTDDVVGDGVQSVTRGTSICAFVLIASVPVFFTGWRMRKRLGIGCCEEEQVISENPPTQECSSKHEDNDGTLRDKDELDAFRYVRIFNYCGHWAVVDKGSQIRVGQVFDFFRPDCGQAGVFRIASQDKDERDVFYIQALNGFEIAEDDLFYPDLYKKAA